MVLREPAQCRGGIRAGIKSTNTGEGEEDEVLCKGEEASRWMEASLARIAGRDELQWLQHVSAHFTQPLELWAGRYSTTKARGRFTTARARKPLKPTGAAKLPVRSMCCATYVPSPVAIAPTPFGTLAAGALLLYQVTDIEPRNLSQLDRASQ